MRSRRWRVSLPVCITLALMSAGCVTYTDHSQACRSSGGLFGPREISCSGTAQAVRGEGPLSLGDDDDDSGSARDYRLRMTASVDEGRMDIHTHTVGEGREGGEVSPGNPLSFEALVPVSGNGSSVSVAVKGGEDAEVRGFEYEATYTSVE